MGRPHVLQFNAWNLVPPLPLLVPTVETRHFSRDFRKSEWRDGDCYQNKSVDDLVVRFHSRRDATAPPKPRLKRLFALGLKAPTICSGRCVAGLEMSKKVVRVGIIGSGLSGLVAANLLNFYNKQDDEQVEYDVHLFERASTLGMDANSHTITAPSGAPFRVDSPMRAMQGGTHDRVFKLYEYLGIPLTQKNFDYSFFIANSRSSSSRLVYEGSNGFGTFPPFKLNPSSSVWEYISISIAYVLLVVFSFGLRCHSLEGDFWRKF
ncbi:hypothetical protein BT69DRAFT_1343627 [Atractiella rhizophila]|nr:hypothetical protein BT69DRAFT_1343627 [Atractiella rhizophila]